MFCRIARLIGPIALATSLWTALGFASSFPLVTVHGIYAINAVHLQAVKGGGSSYQIDSSMLTNSLVDGISIRVFWSDVEPTEGIFAWSTLDSLVAQAAAVGKKVTLRIMPGYSTPSWVYSDGAQPFNFIWDQSGWGPTLCSTASVPVPWDPVFLSKWSDLIQAFGAHYNSNPTVAGIKITGINAESEETNLPLSVNKPIGGGTNSCTSNNDVANWQAIGYKRTLAVSAWEQIAQTFQQSFPNIPLQDAMQPGGFPPIDDNGNLITGFNGADTIASQEIITWAVGTLGTGYILQNDALSASWNWSYQAGFSNQIDLGYQTISALGAGLSPAVNNALKVGGDYFELYEGDITNPALRGTLSFVHSIVG